MKRLLCGSAVLVGLLATLAFADAAPPTCEENLDVMKIVYGTSRSNAEMYLETAARVRVQLDAALAKLKALEAAKTPEKGIEEGKNPVEK